jgi:hypothetical protein
MGEDLDPFTALRGNSKGPILEQLIRHLRSARLRDV